VHLVITDSGVGGLGICAAIENAFRRSGDGVRLTYFNAWPEEGRGYNSLPDQPERLAFFDAALARMGRLMPDRIVIACNTLSVLFPLTSFARASTVPVVGIIDAGVNLFHQALGAQPGSSIALFGTRITIDSGVHRDRLVELGTAPDRIIPVPSHGLAAAIERDPDGAEVGQLIDRACAQAAASARQPGSLFAGLCCTHYGYVADRFRASLERAARRQVLVLDPGGALVTAVATDTTPGSLTAETGVPVVEVLSKVTLDQRTREGIGRLVAPVSSATARALESYTHVPDLF
jgi:glutamate racemase